MNVMASVLNEAYFTDEAAAFAALEGVLWPNGPTCPHCGALDRINRLEGVRSKPSKAHPTRTDQSKSDFVSVARALGCDEDKGRFERALGKIC